MAARPHWSGQIRLGLVSIPVEIYSATKSGATIAFNQIHEPTGKRIKYEKVVPGIGPVDRDEIVKGFEVSKGDYVLLDDEEIEASSWRAEDARAHPVRRRSTRSTRSITTSLIMSCRPTTSPRKRSSCCARRCARTKKVGSASSRCAATNMSSASSRAAAASCWRRCAMPTRSTRRRAISATSATPSPTRSCSTWRRRLIEKKTGKFDAEEFHDRYVDALKELIARSARRRASRSSRTRTKGPPKGSNVIDLMAALKKSLGERQAGAEAAGEEGGGQAGAAANRRPRRRPRKRAAAGARRVSHAGPQARHRRPTTRSATSRRRRSPRAAS